MTPSIDQTLHLFANLLPNWTLIPILTLLPNFGGFHRTFQRVRLANRGRLLLRTPGPVHLGLAFVLMLRQVFPELVMSTDLLSFEHPSVLLFCLFLTCLHWFWRRRFQRWYPSGTRTCMWPLGNRHEINKLERGQDTCFLSNFVEIPAALRKRSIKC